jgi:hypothetical protein
MIHRSLLLVACLSFAGCTGPQLLTTPQQPPLAQGDGFTIEYVETPHKTNRPRLVVKYGPRDASGERPARVRVHGPGGERLKEFRNLFRRSEYAVEIPIDHKAGNAYDTKLTLIVDRSGQPVEQLALMVRLRAIDAPTAPLAPEDPSMFAAVTYPIWGFWRDLVDAPLTMFNRAGLSTSRLGDNNMNAANGMVLVGAFAGAALGAREGFSRGDGPFEDAFYVGAGSVIGGIGGAVVGGIVAGVWDFIVVPVQTMVFRFPFDSDFLKLEPYASNVPVGEGVNLDEYSQRLRSRSYFPNWRFGVRGEELAPSDRSRPVWICEHLGIGSMN